MRICPPYDARLALRYPIGDFDRSALTRAESLAAIASLPAALGDAVAGLSGPQLETPYRGGGWTVRQLVHHIADSHINAYVRTRLALTEDWPTIKPYQEEKWAMLEDARTTPVEVSLALLAPLHRRWVMLWESLGEADWERGYVHPQSGPQSLAIVVALYAWHGRHHTAHVTALRKRMEW